MIDIYISSSSSSSSCRAASTDIPDSLSPLLPIVHRLRQVFQVTSCVLTQLLYVSSGRSSCFCLAICGSPQEYITYELVLASPAVSGVSGSSNLYSFRDGRQVAVQLVSRGGVVARTCSILLSVIHGQTVSLYHNSSMSLDMLGALSRDRNPSKFTLDLIPNRSAISTIIVSSGIITHLYQLSLFFYFYFVLSKTRILNSLKELCI